METVERITQVQQAINILELIIQSIDNFWLRAQLEEAKAEFAKLSDTTTEQPGLNDPVSPPEVQSAEGYFEQFGLHFSNARSFGCVRVQEHYDVGIAFTERSQEIVDQYPGSSLRLVQMTGHAILAEQWHLLPSMVWVGVGRWAVPYQPLQPPEPFVDAETELWWKHWGRFHFSGATLAKTRSSFGPEYGRLDKHPVYGEFMEVTHSNGQKVWDPKAGTELPQHQLLTMPNVPWMVLPMLAAKYLSPETPEHDGNWIQDIYKFMQRKARELDLGRQFDAPDGYAQPGENTDQWRQDHELVVPNFRLI